MTNSTPLINTRILFVIDNDFGELALVLYFLFRQPIASRSSVLMPEWLYQKQASKIAVKTYSYRSRIDILEIVKNEAPDIVFLFSGYLLPSALTNFKEFESLLNDLKAQPFQLVTSDPYLGTLRLFTKFPKKNDKLARITGRFSEFIRTKITIRAVKRISNCLQDIKHLHPVPSPNVEWSNSQNISFYNEKYIRSKEELDALRALNLSASPSDFLLPQWLFILARFDLDYQIQKYGKDAFIALVVDKLKQAIENEKQPTLIAPQELIDELYEHFPSPSMVNLLAECAFDEFEKRLLGAEAVFYWQVFSTSTFLRLLHGLPVFCFDLGHSAHLNTSFHEACMTSYYLGKSPFMLEFSHRLDKAYLSQFTEDFNSIADLFQRKLSALSSPNELLEYLLRNKH